MIVYRTTHTGIHAHDNELIHTRQPAPAAETEVMAIEIDLPDYTAGGPDDSPSMVFGDNGRGYALTYDKHKRTVLLRDSAGRLIKAVSIRGAELAK